MVIVPIHQALSSAPPLSTQVIDLSPLKLISSFVFNQSLQLQQQQQQPFHYHHLHYNKALQILHLGSRVYTLENHDLYVKIDKQVNETVKEVVHDALQALLLDRFRDLSEVQMKEILRDRMFKSGSYRSHPDHSSLHQALERRRDDQDPPLPPPKDSDHSKKKRRDSDASTSQQPQGQQLSAWKTSDTREATVQKSSNSSKQKQASPSAQPIDDILIPDDVHLSNSEDIETPETPESEWVIPLNELPKTENNWADAITKTYKDPEENKLLQKTRDIRSFIKWYCRQIGISKLSKADLEGPSFKVVRPFHTNNISLQFQMEECHLLLTNQIDLVNPEGSKERRNALSISKLKVANYPDFGLEELVPSLWIESEKRTQCPFLDRSAETDPNNMRIPHALVSRPTQDTDAPIMRTASAAAKPCQGDSSEFYLIIGIPDGSSWWPEKSLIHNHMLILDRHIQRHPESSSICFKASATLISHVLLEVTKY
ncbi:hypothetical protein Tco_0536989 [Tanacetum coccineum]